MAINRGKQFEQNIKDAFKKVPDVLVDRVNDQMSGFKGSSNTSDFIVYKYPLLYYIECKTTHENTLNFAKVPQMDKLMEKAEYPGICAGVIVWWVDKDVTRYFPVQVLNSLKMSGVKSIRYDTPLGIKIDGYKKRVFWEYDMKKFFKEMENG